jgi:hypothetical protein
MPSRIPQIVIEEFMKSKRLVVDKSGRNGTMPVDIKVFKAVIQETLQNPAVLQQLVNAAMKQGEFKIG